MNDARTSPPGRRSSGGGMPGIVAGSASVVAGLALLAAGAVVLGVHATCDADGYYATGARVLTTPTRAFVSDRIDVGGSPHWLFRRGRLGTVRVTATGSAGRPIFVGIAPTRAVDAYLRDVAREEIIDFEVDPLSVTAARRVDATAPAAPTTRRFWTRQVTGAGRQALTWRVSGGAWTVVVMNADGTPGVQTALTLGARAGYVLWLGIGLLGGGALLAGGGGAIWLAVRRRARVRATAATSAPA